MNKMQLISLFEGTANYKKDFTELPLKKLPNGKFKQDKNYHLELQSFIAAYKVAYQKAYGTDCCL